MKARYENRSDELYCRDSRYTGKTLGYISHLHRHIELGFVKNGRTHVSVDSDEYEVSAGDIIVVFPNQIHRFQTVEHEEYILLLINLDPELLHIIEKISDIYHENAPYKDMILRGYLTAFFGLLMRKMELRDVQSCDYHVLGMILNYCVTNSDKNLTLGFLEKELHVSKYYISHIMSNKLHMGFNDYINSLRVSNACKYLLNSDKSVTEISELVGFNTLRTFNRAFSKQMGMTPSAYRAKQYADNYVPSVPV